MERRGAARRASQHDVRMTVASERSERTARLVNASCRGALIVLGEPFGYWPGQRVLLSIDHAFRDSLHILGHVRRVEWGSDHRTYVGVEFDEPTEDGFDDDTVRPRRHVVPIG